MTFNEVVERTWGRRDAQGSWWLPLAALAAFLLACLTDCCRPDGLRRRRSPSTQRTWSCLTLCAGLPAPHGRCWWATLATKRQAEGGWGWLLWCMTSHGANPRAHSPPCACCAPLCVAGVCLTRIFLLPPHPVFRLARSAGGRAATLPTWSCPRPRSGYGWACPPRSGSPCTTRTGP